MGVGGWGSDVLTGEVVLDLSSGIAGGYCTWLLASAGATVIKVEDPSGDPLRRRVPSPEMGGRTEDAPLFRFLNQAKRVTVIDPGSAGSIEAVLTLVDQADVIVWSEGSGLARRRELHPKALFDRNPRAVVCSITPFGLDGPWARRPTSDLTLQGWAGAIGYRGDPRFPPVRTWGEISGWSAATFAAIGVLTSRYVADKRGRGDLLDVSMLESVALSCCMTFPVTARAIGGRPLTDGRVITIPGIHRCQDAWVGFMVMTGQQWLDFCVLIDQPAWGGDPSLLFSDNRRARQAEIVGAIDAWAARHSVDEVVEMAAALRVPAAPIGDGSRTPWFDQMVDQGLFEPGPGAGLRQPVPPYRFTLAKETGPAISPGRDDVAADGADDAGAPRRPLRGLRVADLTAFWAGPVVGRYLAMMGADVIKIESHRRPDGFRNYSTKPLDDDQAWEWAPMFQGCNVGKRSLTLDLSVDAGREVLLRLLKVCDVLIENFTPRVMEAWGLDHERLLEVNPNLVVVRMPAFGLEGPWRNRPGYAQTVEQISGLAWATGHPDGPPVVPNGQCDPLGGNFALIALLLALQQRRSTGRGLLVESPLLIGALHLAAEQVLEYTDNGHVLGRTGNRDLPALQGVYRCADTDTERWVAVSVTTDSQWRSLCQACGSPSGLVKMGGSRQDVDHDRFDHELADWCRPRTSEEIVAALWPAGVPVAKVLMPHEQDELDQLSARGFFEAVPHPVTGTHPHATLPIRFETITGSWHQRPAPLLGEHNGEILGGLLGMGTEELADLERKAVIKGPAPVVGC